MQHCKWLASISFVGMIAASFAVRAADVAATTYVAGLQQTPLFLAINQSSIEALYSGVDNGAVPSGLGHTQPMSWSGIGVNAVGGALGMAIVSAATKADNHRFAETHIATLRDASKSAGLQDLLQQSILDSSRQVSWLSGGSTQVVADAKSIAPAQETSSWLEVNARYALSVDFSHVVVVADVELFRQMPGANDGDWRHKPAFHNTVVFQSDALHIPDKTPADSERMLAEENARWNQAAINAEIDELNSLPRFDTTVGKRRRALAEKIDQHKKNLAAAQSSTWDRNQLADEYARAWGNHDQAALKQALHDGGAEIGKMIALTFSGQHDNVPAHEGQAAASHDESSTRLDYVQRNGDVVSVLGNDKLMVGPYFTGG